MSRRSPEITVPQTLDCDAYHRFSVDGCAFICIRGHVLWSRPWVSHRTQRYHGLPINIPKTFRQLIQCQVPGCNRWAHPLMDPALSSISKLAGPEAIFTTWTRGGGTDRRRFHNVFPNSWKLEHYARWKEICGVFVVNGEMKKGRPAKQG